MPVEIGHAFERERLRVPEIPIRSVGLGGEERAVWGKNMEVADGDGEELEGERDGCVTAHVGYYGAEMAAC